MASVDIRNVVKRFGNVQVLHGATLSPSAVSMLQPP